MNRDDSSKTSGAFLGTRMVPLRKLRPHPLNSNVMPEDLRQKLKAHIKETGRYPFLVVRPHPDEEGDFQILDGYHRTLILKELGYAEARCDIWDVNDREAKLLLATLNRLEGQDLPIRRAQLIHDILGEMNIADLSGLIPESERQIEELHSLLEFPADDVAAQLEEEAVEAEKTLPRVMSFVVTPDQEVIIEEAIALASDGIPGRDLRARGLTNLARRFLKENGNEKIAC
jgi:ParB family chromosome partitioning protein